MSNQKGYTLIELLVSSALLSAFIMMVVGYALSVQESFFQDVVRTRINSNLRAAMDIIGMNIKQSGENLQTSFPAVILEDADADNSDIITLRRNLLAEVLTVCDDFDAGESSVVLSTSTASSPSCVTGNVANLHTAFENERTSRGGNIKVFIYDSLTEDGEFLDYTGEGLTGDEYYLTLSSPSRTYEANTSYIYALEEYKFEYDADEDSIELARDGETASTESVAFSISEFTVTLTMDDGSTLTSLDSSSAHDWRDIRSINIVLAGTEQRKTRTFSTSITGEFFPRNILSY